MGDVLKAASKGMFSAAKAIACEQNLKFNGSYVIDCTGCAKFYQDDNGVGHCELHDVD
jgi:hypothetical protein